MPIFTFCLSMEKKKKRYFELKTYPTYLGPRETCQTLRMMSIKNMYHSTDCDFTSRNSLLQIMSLLFILMFVSLLASNIILKNYNKIIDKPLLCFANQCLGILTDFPPSLILVQPHSNKQM